MLTREDMETLMREELANFAKQYEHMWRKFVRQLSKKLNMSEDEVEEELFKL